MLTTQRNEKYDPEYADDITTAKRRLFELRMRKSQRLPFKSSEFRELRKFVARLKTQQRQDELRAQGVDLKKKQPRTRRERQRAREKRERQDTARAENRARLMARNEGARAAMRHLDAHLRGRILDYLDFDEILKATATDRAARAALPCVQEVHGITPRGLSCSCVGIVSQLTRCRGLTVCCADSAEDLRALSWPLRIMKDLRAFTMYFSFGADLTSFPTECDRLVRSGALRQLKDLADLRLGAYDVDGELQPLDVSCVSCAAFKSLLSQLPLDGALQAAVYGLVPAAWVSELLARGANPKFIFDDICVLQVACRRQRLDVIRMLLEAGADPNFHGNRKNTSPLYGLLFRQVNHDYGSRLDVLKLLLEFGVDLGYAQKSNDGVTLLHFVAYNISKHPWPEVLELVKAILKCDTALASALWGRQGETPLNVMLKKHISDEDKIDPAFFDILKTLSIAEARGRRRAKRAAAALGSK